MTTVRATRRVVLPPAEAYALWTDVGRWPTFIEGFAHAVEKDDGWPGDGARLVWQSLPDGRGRVNEKVQRSGEFFVATRIVEDAMHGVQEASFHPGEEGGSVAQLELAYELNPTTVWRTGPLGKVVNVLFIRRAMIDSLGRTLRRFATEAADQHAL
ncbi:MAG TPA: SRPBCC family protein [Thermoleophilaceae bacterium]